MKVLIAPDKFKGSVTAEQVCTAIRLGLLSSDPLLKICEQPLADGGEGTCELLTNFSHGKFVASEVRDPLSRRISTVFGISQDGETAFIEMAKASGLQLVNVSERNPWYTTTVGTGDMIRHALDAGVNHIVMGIGGSATNDGGMGMAIALGVEFYDAKNNRLSGRGCDLESATCIDTSNMHPRLNEVDFTVFCDVDNPLTGTRGASHVFAAQKGADEKMIVALDKGLEHYGKLLQQSTGRRVDFSGAGAGGGLPASLKAFANIEIRAGMEFIIGFIGLEEKVRQTDVVFTGEGKVDIQTLSGKVVKGVSDLAKKYSKPLIVVAGKSDVTIRDLQDLKIQKLLTLTADGTSDKLAMEKAPELIEKLVKGAWAEYKGKVSYNNDGLEN
ncbi:MAG: glycerate kinase [Chryseolinea sp.]